MKKQIFQERLELLNEAREKICKMGKKNVFVMDISALDILKRLSTSYQKMLSENLALEEKIKLLTVRASRKK